MRPIKTYSLECRVPKNSKRDKKAFLSDQCKETEGKKKKKRMGKTRDSFKKITDTKGIFHAKMGTIKDRNGKEVNRIHRKAIKKRSL